MTLQLLLGLSFPPAEPCLHWKILVTSLEITVISQVLPDRNTAVYYRLKDYVGNSRHWSTHLLTQYFMKVTCYILASVYAGFSSKSFLSVIHVSVMNCLGFSYWKCKLFFFPAIRYHSSYKLALSLKKWLLKGVLSERF